MIKNVLEKANRTFFATRSMKLELLKNCPEAIPVLVEWLYEEWRHYDRTLTREKLVLSFNGRMKDEGIPIAFVAWKGEKPIGVVSLKGQEFPDFPADSLWVGSLQVVPEERGQGVGEALLRFVQEVAKGMGQEKVYFYTSNPVNVGWYEGRGAEVIEERLFRNHTVTIMAIIG